MTPMLATALVVLVYSLTTLSTMATIYLLFNLFSSDNSAKNKPVVVKVEPVEKDNSYTKWAAEAQAAGVERAASIAAKAQIDVAKINAAAAADNLAAEQARLERVRIEQAKRPA